MQRRKTFRIIVFAVCGIIAALIILPAFKPPKDGAGYTRVMCASNLHQLSLACKFYSNENGVYPNKSSWTDAVKDNLGGVSAFQCYIDKIGPCSYAMNKNIPTDANELPPDLVLLFESAPGWNNIGGPEEVVTDRHDQPGANIAFADGHVEFVKPEDIPHLRWTIDNP